MNRRSKGTATNVWGAKSNFPRNSATFLYTLKFFKTTENNVMFVTL